MSFDTDVWSVPCGDDSSIAVTIKGSDNQPITGYYDGSETLSWDLWQGGDLTELADVLTLAWVVATDATTTATIVGSATVDVTPGVYLARFHITKDGVKSCYFEARIEFTAAPGSAAEPAVYGSLQDMADIAGSWFAGLASRAKLTNFLSERARARRWLDTIVVSKSRPWSYQFDLLTSTIYFSPVEAEDAWIRGKLDANCLMIDQSIIEIVSYKALAFACEGKVALDEKQGDAWEKRAAACHARARNLLLCTRAQLDTNADGSADVGFNLGVSSFR